MQTDEGRTRDERDDHPSACAPRVRVRPRHNVARTRFHPTAWAAAAAGGEDGDDLAQQPTGPGLDRRSTDCGGKL